jgi:hypothetical protein
VVNTAIPPNQPTARRCIEIGKRIERALEECDCDTRIGLIGFGGFSPFAVDEDLNQAIARHLREGDEGALARLPRERLDAGMADLRPWLVVAGAAKALDVQVLDYRPWYDAGTTTGPSQRCTPPSGVDAELHRSTLDLSILYREYERTKGRCVPCPTTLRFSF